MWTAGDGQSNNGYGYTAPSPATAVLEPKEVKPPGLQGFSDRQFGQGFPPITNLSHFVLFVAHAEIFSHLVEA